PGCGAASPQPLAYVADHGVEGAPVRPRMGVHRERRHGDHEVRAFRDRRRGVGLGPQPARAHDLSERLLEPGFAREWRPRLVHKPHDALVDVAAHDLVTGARDLRGDRQADLAKGDDDRPHGAATAPGRNTTVSREAALVSTASAYATVSMPSSSVTISASPSPRRSAQKVSSSTSNGSRRE